MSLNIVEIPYPYFPDFNRGRPLYNASIYVGVVDTDPENIINQKQVTVRQEDGTEIPVPQPILTSSGGVPIYNGGPVAILVDGSYSIKVLDNQGNQEYYSPDVTKGIPITEENIPTYTDIVYKESGSNSAVENMIAGNPIEASDGDVVSTGGTAWEISTDISTIALDNGLYAAPLSYVYMIDFTVGTLDTTAAYILFLSVTGEKVINDAVSVTGGADVNQNLKGTGRSQSVVSVVTSNPDEFIHELQSGGSISDLTILAEVTAPAVPNSRANNAILVGPRTSTSDELFEKFKISNVSVVKSGSAAPISNAITMINNVTEGSIEDILVQGEFGQGILMHWNYSTNGRTSHPRFLHAKNIKIRAFDNDGDGWSLAGCHDITVERVEIQDTSRGFVVGTGDLGGDNPNNESVDRVMSNINIRDLTMYNVVNEGLWMVGRSFVLDSNNRRWLAIDQENTCVNAEGVVGLRGAQSASNECIQLNMMRNVNITKATLGLVGTSQRDNTGFIIGIDTVINSSIQANTNCVQAVDVLNGQNIDLDITHTSSSTLGVGNGIQIRGGISSEAVYAVAINDTQIQFKQLGQSIYAGMKAEYMGNEIEFTTSAFSNPSDNTQNTDIIVGIKPSPVVIPDNDPIELIWGGRNIKIKGKIKGAQKGFRMAPTDPRCCDGIEIDCDFEESITTDIEVGQGITIKRFGWFYYNDVGGTLQINGVTPVQNQVIWYQEVGGKKIGYSKIGAPTSTTKQYNIGDIIYDYTDPTTGFRCTVAGAPATWVAF